MSGMDLVCAALMTFGALLMLLAAVGVVRLPDILLRLSATSKASTLGVGSLALATAIHLGDLGATARALAILLFVLLTTPVAAHQIARAAYFVGAPLWKGMVRDELRGRYDARTHDLASGAGSAEEGE